MKIFYYLIAGLLLSACSVISHDNLEIHTTWVPQASSNENGQVPVVFYFQGSGGNNIRAGEWHGVFAKYGIASVFIDSAGARGMMMLYGVDYARDIAVALENAKKDSRLDMSRYAIMGFSRGGTAALEAGSYIDSNYSRPDFVFSLYPGWNGYCPNSHNDETQVLVFYGDLDEGGSYGGTRNACRGMAKRKENTTFYMLKDTHHGYDHRYSFSSNVRGNIIRVIPNKEATKRTEEIIIEKIEKTWGLKPELYF